MLKDRGLAIIDEAAAQKVLGSISYFRLANYFRPMETDKQNHQFKPGATFENAVRLYDFDASLRELVFKAIARIEIALRTKMIHHFSLAHGAFWFADESLSKEERLFQENIGSVERELHRTKEEFIKDHFKKYDSPPFPPAWKTLEVVSFGVLSKMYYNFSDIKVKKNVARSLDLPQHKILESWAASLAALRNCCAHHAPELSRYACHSRQAEKRMDKQYRRGRQQTVHTAMLHCLPAEQHPSRQRIHANTERPDRCLS